MEEGDGKGCGNGGRSDASGDDAGQSHSRNSDSSIYRTNHSLIWPCAKERSLETTDEVLDSIPWRRLFNGRHCTADIQLLCLVMRFWFNYIEDNYAAQITLLVAQCGSQRTDWFVPALSQ